jgi:hypothetical protein
MATTSEIKEHVEAILGHKLEDEAVQLIQLLQPVALSTTESGRLTRRHLIIAAPNICGDSDMLDVSGLATTANNGQSVFRLTDFLCPSEISFSQPVNVVATPFSSTPCFLTVVHSILNNGADVEIKIFAWDANGAAAPNVSLNWRCRVQLRATV